MKTLQNALIVALELEKEKSYWEESDMISAYITKKALLNMYLKEKKAKNKGPCMKILVVDDELDLLNIIVESLNYDGIESVGASTVEEALNAKCTHALIDGMCGRGIVLAKELKSRGIKVYSFSGSNSISEEGKNIYNGMIPKPCDSSDIINILKK